MSAGLRVDGRLDEQFSGVGRRNGAMMVGQFSASSRLGLMTSPSSCYAGDDEDDYSAADCGSYESFGTHDYLIADQTSQPCRQDCFSLCALKTSVSMPGHICSSKDMPPDPFPELSRSKLAPVSARLCSFDDGLREPTRSAESNYSLSDENAVRVSAGSPPRSDCINNRVLSERVSVNFYNDDQLSHQLTVDSNTTVADVCQQLVLRNHTSHSPHWTIVERLGRYQLERGVEHHESVYDIFKTWSSDDDSRFYFRKDFSKYELFRNPTQFFPEQMVDTKTSLREDTHGILTRSERYKNLLLQNLLANQCIPDIQGYVHVREGKKSWKKYFYVLRGSGLYCSTKGQQKEPQYLQLISHLDDVNIYTAHNAKKVFGAPTNYGFCLRPSHGVSDARHFKVFCTSDEQSRLCWITGMRFVKYGAQLRENLRLTLKCEDSSRTSDDDPNLDANLYVKSRVAMDFSGERGRVVADPNEALSVAVEEGHNWRKKVALRPAVTQAQPRMPTDSVVQEHAQMVQRSRSPVAAIHLTEPWFHGHISRQMAVALIKEQGLVDGVFLLRTSESVPNCFVLSFCYNQMVRHCMIKKVEMDGVMYYSLDEGKTKFMDLLQLVDFYQLNELNPGVLPVKLTYYVTRLL